MNKIRANEVAKAIKDKFGVRSEIREFSDSYFLELAASVDEYDMERFLEDYLTEDEVEQYLIESEDSITLYK